MDKELIFDSAGYRGGQTSAAVTAQPEELLSPPETQEGGARRPGETKRLIFRYLQPATIVAMLLFWGLGPKWLTTNPLTLAIMGPSVIAMVLGLEWVNERYRSWRLTEEEFLRDLYWFVFTRSGIIALISVPFIKEPLLGLKADLGISTPWFADLPFVVQVAGIWSITEFTQYWVHRLFHSRPLWRIHAPHHMLLQMNAMKSLVGNPLEYFALGLTLVIFLDADPNALFCAGSIGSAVTKFAHANIRFDPPRWYSYFVTTIEHHSLHHSVEWEPTNSNYGNSLIFWDRLFGTYMEGDAEIVGCQEDRKRQSLWDQHVYPFIPAANWVKAKFRASRPGT